MEVYIACLCVLKKKPAFVMSYYDVTWCVE
jgi:hypothetical protein